MLVMECVAGLSQGTREISGRNRSKLEAGRGTTGHVGFFNVNNRVRKAADA